MFSVILEEIKRTSCQPREVCVEVSKEYPESTSQMYLPRCVALHRCGGCCTEGHYCANTSHSLVNKTVSAGLSPAFIFCVYDLCHTLFHYMTVLVFSALTPQIASSKRKGTNSVSYVTSSPVSHHIPPHPDTGHRHNTTHVTISCTILQQLH